MSTTAVSSMVVTWRLMQQVELIAVKRSINNSYNYREMLRPGYLLLIILEYGTRN